MNLTGARRFAGFSNQGAGSAAVQIWKLSWYAPDGTTLINANGQLVPLSGSLRHSADLKFLKDSRGNEVTVLATNEKITIEVVAVPNGANGANSLRDAIESATFPAPNGWVSLLSDASNANPLVIPMGSFTNSLDSTAWMYNSDGSIELASDNEWGMRFTLTRRANMARVAAVVI